MKKLVCLFMALVMIMSLSFMAFAGEDSDYSYGGEINIATVSCAGSLDPAGVAIDMWTEYAKLCTDGLISYDSEGNIVYETAESFDVSEDGLVYTFYLRENAKWSDGSDVTADDFINTIMRALDPENGGAIYANMLYGIKGAEEFHNGEATEDDVMAKALDAHTLQFTLDEPCSYFLKMMTVPVFYPSKAGLASNDDEGWYKDPEKSLGNGAFCLESYSEGEGYTVVKNPYYYQADKVYLDKINVYFITDTTALMASYVTGEMDVVTGLPDYVADDYTEEDGLFIWTMLTSKFILPNLEVEPLDNELVREAIALALNRTEICAAIGNDYIPSVNYVAEYMLSPAGEQYFKDEVEELFVEDEERARELLAEAGYPNGEGFPTLSYKYPNSEKDSLLAQGIQAQLKEVLNIDIVLEGEEDGVWSSDRENGDYDLIRHSWTADFNDPINYLSLYVTGASSNYNHVSDAAYDEAIEKSNSAATVEERVEYLHEAQKILVSDNFYVIPAVTQVYICLINPDLENISTNDKGEPLYRFAALK